MLANLAVKDLDRDLASLAASNGLAYTRYADDLYFSTDDGSFTRGLAEKFLRSANARLRKEGLLPHNEKTRISPPGARKVVLGLLVDGTHPRLQREFKQRLLMHAYYMNKYGPANHAAARGFRSLWSLRRHVSGLLAYAKQVEPHFGADAERKLSSIDWGSLDDDK
jgi:RNA-directed DNA polymerase